MKIAYDAKRAFLNSTGLGNYSRWLIKSMALYYPANQYLLYTPKIKPERSPEFLQQFSNIHTHLPQGKLLKSLWRSKGIVDDLKRDGVELYHGLSHELPLGIKESGIKSVVTIHDLIFMHYPDQYGWLSRNIYYMKLKSACTVADRILAISQKTKDDIVQLLHVDPSRIEVMYQGCDPAYKVKLGEGVLKNVAKKYGLPKRFILNVGTIEERKNLLLIAKAMTHAKTDVPVVVVGKQKKYFNEVQQFIKDHKLKDKFIFLDKLGFEDLTALYQQAALFIYPSRYEGFGIPVLEAITSGAPVIAAKGSCLEEAGGPGTMYVGPDDEVELALQIDTILTDEQLRQSMITTGLEYAKNFDDEKLAAQLNNIYQHA